jgi:hypothetical protein
VSQAKSTTVGAGSKPQQLDRSPAHLGVEQPIAERALVDRRELAVPAKHAAELG